MLLFFTSFFFLPYCRFMSPQKNKFIVRLRMIHDIMSRDSLFLLLRISSSLTCNVRNSIFGKAFLSFFAMMSA